MSKKVMILVVILECVLSILLIAVLGKAVESYYNTVKAGEVYFTTFTSDVTVILKEGETEEMFSRTQDGKIILAPGMLYKEKEKTVETLPNEDYNYEGAQDDIIIEYMNPGNVVLSYIILPEDTTDQTVEFKTSNPLVSVDNTCRVQFEEVTDRPVQVTIKASSKAATVILQQRKKNKVVIMP